MTQERLGPENEQCYTMLQGGCYPEVEAEIVWEQCKWDFLIKTGDFAKRNEVRKEEAKGLNESSIKIKVK